MLTWTNVWIFFRPLVKMALILLVGHILIKLVMKIIKRGFIRSKLDPSLSKYCVKAITVALYLFIALAALDAIGVSTSGIVAALSAAVVAIGLALKDSLNNIVGGIWLLFSPRFSTGDYIAVDGDEGTVISIDIVHTNLQTFDGKQVSIPNGTLLNNNIINYSVENNRRVDILFPISYETDVNKAKSLALATVSNHPNVLSNEGNEPFVRVKSYSESSVNLTIRAWCKNEDYWIVFYDLTEQIRDVFSQNGINLPYNQLDVHIKTDTENK